MRRWAGDFKGACFYGSVGRDDLWDAIFDLAGCDDGGGLCAFFSETISCFAKDDFSSGGSVERDDLWDAIFD